MSEQRTKRNRRFPAVYRGPDLTDDGVNLNEFTPDEIEGFLADSKLTDDELSEINFREIAEDMATLEVAGNQNNTTGSVGKDATDEVN